MTPVKAKIVEVFRSIQGEGPYAGVPQVFVRFFECHMHCSWCDTPDSIGDTTKEYKEFNEQELLQSVKIASRGVHSVSLTGGEPLLQAEFLHHFIPQLRQEGFRIFLETSGVLHGALQGLIDQLDIVSMDLKLPSSTKEKPFWKEHERFLTIALAKEVYAKMVVTADTRDEDVHTAVALIERINPHVRLFIQPNSFELKPLLIDKCAEYQEYGLKFLNDVRVMPQVHRLMGVR